MSAAGTAVVAGAGIGGLAAAVALAGHGFQVSVLERAERVAATGAGLVLYQNGLAAAHALNPALGSRIRAAGYLVAPGDVRLLMDSTGRVLAHEPIGDMAWRRGLSQVPILRSALCDALLREALDAGARVQPGTPVQGYRRAGRWVRVRLASGGFVDTDLLVGADGINSAVRATMLDDGPPCYRGYTSVRGLTRGSRLYPQAFVISGRGLQIFAAPTGDATLYWTAKITSPPRVWPAKGARRAWADLISALDGWYEPVVQLVRSADPDDITVTDIHDREPVRRWVDGPVALLGDAAHPMVPAMGQGANLALEDAVVLAQALRACPDPALALRRYQADRVMRAAMVVRLSRRQGAVDQGAGPLAALLRDATMRLRGRKDARTLAVVSWRPDRPTAARSDIDKSLD